MKIEHTPIEGLLIIEPDVFEDERGYFFESFNKRELEDIGVSNTDFVQDNQSMSVYGVIRGLHYQLFPHAQCKLVRAQEGRIFDVAVDLRQESSTFGKWFGIELTADNKKQLYIPCGFAHGFSVLSESALFTYKCSSYYDPKSERGIAYNDPFLGIDWRVEKGREIVSEKDISNPLFKRAEM